VHAQAEDFEEGLEGEGGGSDVMFLFVWKFVLPLTFFCSHEFLVFDQ
jgi:hypothetical protein